MKQIVPTKVRINNIDFYITPFAAFYASNLFGEISAVVAPLLTGLMPILQVEGEFSFDKIKVDDIIPPLAEALSNVDGDRIENLLKKLLINKQNVAYCYKDENGDNVADKLSFDDANEMFCQDIFGMYKLAFEVIKLNYGSFFGKVPSQFGNVQDIIKMKM